MRTRKPLLIVVAMAFALAVPFAQAANLTWDANGTTAPNPNDGTGTWLAADRWWDGTTNVTWNNSTPDNAAIGNGGAGGTITLGGVNAGSVTFTNFTGTYTLSGGGITNSGGITIAANAGNVTCTTVPIGGAGGITKYGPGKLILDAASAAPSTYSGPTRVLGGILQIGAIWNNNESSLPGGIQGVPTSGSNLEISNAVVSLQWDMKRALGAGPGQVQIPGGRSGINMVANPRPSWSVSNNVNYEVVWGAANEAGNALATGFFNPSVFVMNDAAASPGYQFGFLNKIDLNGSDRTIEAASAAWYGYLPGVIRNSQGTPAGIIKTGVGELQLQAANTFDGPVTINGGTLTASSIANGGANSSIGKSSNDAANLLLANGTTLKYTGGAASSDRSFTINGTAAGDSATLDASGSGALNLTSTATPGYGAANQTRTLILTGTQTGTNTLAATFADNGTGALSVTKTGAGKWILTGANTYTGPTTVNAGLLVVGAANNLGSGGTLVLNGGGLSISGTTLHSYSDLVHTIVFGPHHTTLTLDIAHSANTFSVDQSMLSGGLLLSGAGTAAFPGSLTNLVLNVPTGVTATYGGVIADGAAGMTVTTIGAGTQILTGTSTYTGATYLNAGQLNIGNGSTNGKISGTAGLVFNGGSLLLSRTSNANIDAINNAATIAVNGGGTFNVTSSSGGASAIENIGAVTVNSGAMNLVQTANNQNTLTLASLGMGPNADAAVTFSSPAFTTAAFAVSGASATAANEIIGPWATVGTAANAQTDYAIYDSSSRFVARNIAASAESTWATAWAADANHTVTLAAGTATQLTATRSINSLRNTAGTSQNITSIAANVLTVTGSAYANGDVVVTGNTIPTGLAKDTVYYVVNASGTTFQLATTPGGSAIAGLTHVANSPLTGGIRLSSGYNLMTYGILNGSATTLSIGGATGAGVLTTPTGGGNLYLTTGSGAININAPITDNGGAVTVVKGGTTGRLVLSGNNTFTGGLVVNAGVTANSVRLVGTQSFTGGITLNGGGLGENSANATPTTSIAALNGNTITVNGLSHLVLEPGTLSDTSTITINAAGVLSIGPSSGAALNVPGLVSGSGVLDVNPSSGNYSGSSVNLINSVNTFSGNVIYGSTQGQPYVLNVNSIGDSGKVIFGFGGGNSTFALNSTAASGLTFDTRQFELVGAAGAYNLPKIGNNSAQAFTINTDLLATGTGARTLTLQGTGTGLSTFAGKIVDGTGVAISLTKADTGTWMLSNTNAYSGTTTINAGILSINSITNVNGGASALGTPISVANGTISIGSSGTAGTLQYTGSGHTSDRVINLAGTTGGATLDASGSGALILTSPLTATGAGAKPLTLDGTSTAANTLGSAIVDSTSATSFTKAGSGTWVLLGANTFTGTTAVNGGTLRLGYASQNNSKLANAAALTLGGGTLELSGGSHTEVVASLTLTAGTASRITRTSGTSIIQLGAITRGAGATLDISAANIATTTTANDANGVLPGVTINGTQIACNDGSGNIVAYSAYTDVQRLTPGVIPNTSTTNVRLIEGSGTPGNIALAAATTTINTLLQSDQGGTSAATIDAVSKTFGVASIVSDPTSGALTIGTAVGSAGTLRTALAASGADLLLVNNSANPLTINSVVANNSGNGTVTLSGSGTIVLAGANTFSGATKINSGILNVRHNTGLGTTAGGVTVASGASLELQNGIIIGAEALSLNGTGISDGGTLRNISGNNAYGGAVTLGTGGARINSDGGTLTLSGGIVTASGKDLTIGGAGNVTLSTAAISGAGNLIKDGAGTLTLSFASTYTGATTINGGTLALGANNVLANTTAMSIGSATLDVATFTDTVGTLDVRGTSTINVGDGAALAFANSSGIDWTGGTLALTGTFVRGSSLRFGTTSSGLTSTQLALISMSGWKTFTLDSNGYLTAVEAVPPAVLNVTSTNQNGTYSYSAVIEVTVQFSEAVSVSGTPRLTLETGTTDRTVDYTSGSGSDTLTFRYTVQLGDLSADLDYTGTGALALNGGTIRDAEENDATLTLPTPGAAGSLGANKALVIFAGTNPSVFRFR